MSALRGRSQIIFATYCVIVTLGGGGGGPPVRAVRYGANFIFFGRTFDLVFVCLAMYS